ncbi:MAG: DUF2845 domain-containing protein [Panacagrimonas sp.]
MLSVLAAPGFESRAGDSMRCGSRLVSVEALAAEILSACGEPDFRDVFPYPGVEGPGVIADVEQWSYNFGPNQLLRVLKLRNGRLIDIESDGYGFRRDAASRCDPSALVDGLSKFRLVRSCGEPLTRRRLGYVQTQPRHRDRSGGHSRPRRSYPIEVYREEWVYNFGSRYLLKIVTLEDGVVADVQNGDRGFDRR